MAQATAPILDSTRTVIALGIAAWRSSFQHPGLRIYRRLQGERCCCQRKSQFLKDANTLLGELRHENIVVLIGMGNYIIPPACQPFADLR